LWRRPRPKLGCGTKEKRRRRTVILNYSLNNNNYNLFYKQKAVFDSLAISGSQ
jgi:hypothetical protein